MMIPVSRFGLCEKCVHRHSCGERSPSVSSCSRGGSSFKTTSFKADLDEVERIREINTREVERFFAKLTRTDRSQVDHTSRYELIYRPKPKDVRRFNSRSDTTIKVSGDGLDLKRFCENCGAGFHTTEKSRRLCDECHDEI